MTDSPLKDILICGGGLAGWMAASALAHGLPPEFKITVLDIKGSDEFDMFYGSVAGPSSYSFNLGAGVSEPDLILNTNTSFSYGTQYISWGPRNLSWVQCHHAPFPVLEGIPFAHFINMPGNEQLETYAVSAQAALNGRFAHPPSQPDHPASKAEYGYQFDPSEWAGIFKKSAIPKGVHVIKTESIEVRREDGSIAELLLSDGSRISADLYVDCTGPRTCLSKIEPESSSGIKLGVSAEKVRASELGPPARRVVGSAYGWQSETYLKDGVHKLAVYDMRREISVKADVNDDSGHTTPIALSHSAKAWAENCVAIGHAASVIEPLTPAPVMLLQRDIERLLSLIPISLNMSVEAQQYNRAYALDYQHAEIFNAAFLVMENTPDNDYWIRDMTPDIISKLDRKLAQFLSRGALVSYDLEPFNSEDWSILHYGMQRQPKRRDVFAAQQDKSRIGTQLNGLQKSISDTVRKMPPHHIYMDKLVSYLKRKQGSHV